MSDPSINRQRRGFRSALPGLVISLIAVILLLAVSDLEAVGEALRYADYRFLPPVLIIFMITILIRSEAWRTILQGKAPLSRTFIALNEGYLLNNILPFRLGEIGRALLLSRSVGLSFWGVFSTVIIERVIDVAIMAGLLIGTLPFVIGADWAKQAALLAGILVAIGFTVLVLLVRHRQFVLGWVDRLLQRWPNLQGMVRSRAESFLEGLTPIADVRLLARIIPLMLLTWGLNIAWYTILLYVFFPNVEVLWGIFGVGVASLGVAVPSSPAYIGVLEASLVGAFSVFGLDTSISLAYAITAHSIYFILTAVLGVIGLIRDGESITSLYSEVRRMATQKREGG